MFDYEGSRGEFLKLLVEMGEEPAFLARARALQIALDAFLHSCQAKHEELLKWPKLQLSILAHQIHGDWSRLNAFFVDPTASTKLERLFAVMQSKLPVESDWLLRDK